MMQELESRRADIRQWLDDVRARLPATVEARALSTKTRLPFKALCCRAALIWRVEELGRTAFDICEKGDAVAAMVLARSLIETASALWYLKDLLERQVEDGVQADLDEVLMRLLVGSKITGPQALNVLTLVDGVSKKLGSIRSIYDNLSESAHPNFDGAGGAFSRIDYSKDVVHFGRGITRADYRRLIFPALAVGLPLSIRAFDIVSDLMPKFTEQCEHARSNK
jgi:hypothetical protein